MSKHSPKSIIKPHLDYDGEGYRPLGNELEYIVATHGCSIGNVARMLLAGKFVASRRELSLGLTDDDQFSQEFYATPTPEIAKTIDKYEILKGVDPQQLAKFDPFSVSIEYAQTYTPNDYIDDIRKINTLGAVVAFSGNLSLKGAELYIDDLAEQHVDSPLSLELILPKAPNINDIYGIYPIDLESEEKLFEKIPNIF